LISVAVRSLWIRRVAYRAKWSSTCFILQYQNPIWERSRATCIWISGAPCLDISRRQTCTAGSHTTVPTSVLYIRLTERWGQTRSAMDSGPLRWELYLNRRPHMFLSCNILVDLHFLSLAGLRQACGWPQLSTFSTSMILAIEGDFNFIESIKL